jgi:ribosomal protein S18 acetylase RimI-like enzyme
MAVEVRFAEMSDLVAVRDFGRRVVLAFYESIGLREYGQTVVTQYWESRAQENAIADRRVIVADDDGTIVGVTEFGCHEGEPIMWKLYVEPVMRGRGIGSKLVDEVIAAVAGEASSVLTEHAAENNEAALFYDRAGFNIAWIEEGEGPGATTVWRRKQLPLQATSLQ